MTDQPSCRIHTEPLEEGVELIEVEGEVDFGNVGRLEGALDDAAGDGKPAVVVDLTGLAFIDSSGIAALIRAQRSLKEKGRSLIVVRPHDDPLRLLQLKGLEQLLKICSTRADALSLLARS